MAFYRRRKTETIGLTFAVALSGYATAGACATGADDAKIKSPSALLASARDLFADSGKLLTRR
jgi:hypothetical protein